jgi:hypothetical protein
MEIIKSVNEKVFNLNDYIIALTSTIILISIENYLILNHTCSIRKVTDNIGLSTINYGALTTILLIVLLFNSIFVRLLRKVLVFLFFHYRKGQPEDILFYSYKELQEKAVRDNNSVMYAHVESILKNAKKLNNIKCLLLTLIVVCSWNLYLGSSQEISSLTTLIAFSDVTSFVGIVIALAMLLIAISPEPNVESLSLYMKKNPST